MATKKKAAVKKSAPEKKPNTKEEKEKGDEKAAAKIVSKGKTTDELASEVSAAKPLKKPGHVTITKVKIGKKDGVSVDLSVIEHDGSVTKDNKNFSRPVHPDLKACLTSLAVHYGILLDYINPASVRDINNVSPDLVKNIVVSGISIGGNDGEEGVVITGHKISRRKKAIIANTPFERFEEVAETRYRYMDDLDEKISILLKEVGMYMSGEKVGESPQQSLDFPAPKDNKSDEAGGEGDAAMSDDDEDFEKEEIDPW